MFLPAINLYKGGCRTNDFIDDDLGNVHPNNKLLILTQCRVKGEKKSWGGGCSLDEYGKLVIGLKTSEVIIDYVIHPMPRVNMLISKVVQIPTIS